MEENLKFKLARLSPMLLSQPLRKDNYSPYFYIYQAATNLNFILYIFTESQRAEKVVKLSFGAITQEWITVEPRDI